MIQNLTSGLDTLIKSSSLTGNTTVDLILMSHIIPIGISYIQFLINSTSNLIKNIFQFIICYIKYYIKNKYVGNIIYTMSIDYKSELHIFLEDNIFKDNIKGDIENDYLQSILDSSKKSNDENWMNKYFELRKYLKLFINYEKASKKDNLIDGIANTEKDNYTIEESKIFNYKDYRIKIRSLLNNFKNDIFIDVISFTNEKYKHEIYLKLIEEFLNDKFDMNVRIPYVYELNVSNTSLNNILISFINNCKKDTISGLLNCGETKKKKYISETISGKMNVFVNNAIINNPDKDYLDDIQIYNYDTNKINNNLDDFKSLYNKYISKELKRQDKVGFYHRNDITILIICKGSNNGSFNLDYNESNIYIISYGKILKKNDIYDEVNYIIKSYLNQNMNTKNENRVPKIHSRTRCKWSSQTLEKRDFNTVYLPSKQLIDIKNEINNFINTKKLYDAFQIPYRKGLLFYGPPGTGKTSLIKAIANEYGLDIYLININDQDINDDTICDILGSIGGGGNRILLFEDIDSAFSNKEAVKFENKNNSVQKSEEENLIDRNSSQKFLTYSGLLNALDGLKSSHNGVITIMTTNYIDKLGDAFIRPGRIDKKFELTYCNDEQIYNMLQSFISKILSILDNNKYKISDLEENTILDLKIKEFIKNIANTKIKPCELQSYIMKYIEDIDGMFSNFDELKF
jgi:hypothetical protein